MNGKSSLVGRIPSALAVLVPMFALHAGSSHAGVIGWSGSSQDDRVDWSALGAEGAIASNPFSISSTHGLGLTVSMPTGEFERVDEGSSWIGNFRLGEALLWTAYNEGPVTFLFDSPIWGFGGGARVQPDFYGSFGVIISAFDAQNATLGTINLLGTSTDKEDGSAIFAGLLSDSANIRSISIQVTGSGSSLSGFALGELLLKTQPAGVPDSWIPGFEWGLAAFGLGCSRLFKRVRMPNARR